MLVLRLGHPAICASAVGNQPGVRTGRHIEKTQQLSTCCGGVSTSKSWQTTTNQIGKAIVIAASSLVGPVQVALAAEAVVASSSSASNPIDLENTSYLEAMAANPVAVVAGLIAFSLPYVLPKLLKLDEPPNYGLVTAKEAYAALSTTGKTTQLLDVRAGDSDEYRDVMPNITPLEKEVVQLPFTGQDDYAAQAFANVEDAENTTVFILDGLNGNSLAVAKLLANNGFKGAYAIEGGIEGPAGWLMCDLPWLLRPTQVASDDGIPKDIIDGDMKTNPKELVDEVEVHASSSS
ncbi:hypothetical protein BDL97_04G087700 [Sphagnum fallax]|nr:hypothetical protein BDL97_04G087700 [Sphagnum fallax]